MSETSTRVDPRRVTAFPALRDDQIAALEPFGQRLEVAIGEAVWEAGATNLCMFVVVAGEVAVRDARSQEHVALHRPGGFSGDIDVLSGRPALVSAVATQASVLLEIPGDCVRSIVGELPEIGDLILRAFLARRAIMQEMRHVGALVIGSRYSGDTVRIREFLDRNRYPHDYEELETDPDTARLLLEFDVSEDDIPVVVCPNGDVLRAPTNEALAQALGISHTVSDKVYDLIVVGAGPAGLAAAVYGASEGLSTLVVESLGPGGQAGSSSRIENYLGFPNGVAGRELADQAVVQAERFGAEFVVSQPVTSIICREVGGHEVELSDGKKIEARCVVLATGARYRRLAADAERKYDGLGVYYAATNLERLLCKAESVGVVGAGNSAGQAAMFMSANSRQVFLIVRGGDLRASMSNYLALRIDRAPNITVLLHTEVAELHGESCLESLTLCNRNTGEIRTEPIKGLFVMIGAAPNTEWLPPEVARDAKGFVLTGNRLVRERKWNLDRPPYYLETSCPGIFAVGDNRAESVKRVASAVGEGSMSVAFVHQFLAL